MSEEKAPRQKAKKAEEETAPVVQPAVVRRVGKSISFDQWAKARGIRPQHQRGMRAHVRDIHRSRPAEEWDQAFANY